jgi:hypothetical protein
MVKPVTLQTEYINVEVIDQPFAHASQLIVGLISRARGCIYIQVSVQDLGPGVSWQAATEVASCC